MPIEQVVNFIVVLLCGFYAATREDTSRIGGLKQIGIGAILVLLQLILNKTFGGDMLGVPVSPMDVLLLKEMSFNFAFAVLGYFFICAGFFGIMKSLLASREHTEEPPSPH